MTVLAGAIGVGDAQIVVNTTLTVGSYPAPYTIGSENISVTGGSGSTVLSVLRGQNGTARGEHLVGVAITSGWYSGGGGGIPTCAGSPVGTVTPSGIGGLVVDSTSGSLYIAIGVTSADWIILGGYATNGVGETAGVDFRTRVLSLIGGDPNIPLDTTGVEISDAYSEWNGNAYGVRWNGGGTEGSQTFVIALAGGTSQFVADGTFSTAKGIRFPVVDPHILGAWWDDAGTLTKSNG